MARICAECREPVSPVNLCICPDEDDVTERLGGEDETT